MRSFASKYHWKQSCKVWLQWAHAQNEHLLVFGCCYHPQRVGYTPGQNLLGRHPMGRHPLDRHPLGRHTPWADTPHWADTLSPSKPCPGQTPPRRPLQQTVRILLECIILVRVPTFPDWQNSPDFSLTFPSIFGHFFQYFFNVLFFNWKFNPFYQRCTDSSFKYH